MSVIGILLCGGSSQRMGFNKLTAPLGGRTAIEYSMRLMACCDRLVIAVTDDARAAVERVPLGIPVILCDGGATRGQSVLNALRASHGQRGDVVAIHDAARCFQTAEAFDTAVQSGRENGSGVASLPMTDSVFQRDGSAPLDRASLVCTQTPQAFRFEEILSAYEQAGDRNATDDAALYARFIGPLTFTPGSTTGYKLTTREDWAFAQASLHSPRTGMGFDTHVLGAGRKLILGGVEIPFEKGLLGHSDADVIVHAIMDSLLGAAALGDIGQHFPDTDPAWEGASSIAMLAQVGRILEEHNYMIENIDSTIIAQRPKLMPYLPQMRENVARALKLETDQVSIKATTEERLGFTGSGEGIAAQAVCCLIPLMDLVTDDIVMSGGGCGGCSGCAGRI